MKKITLKVLMTGLIMFYGVFCYSQVTVTITDISYTSGGYIDSGDPIEIEYGNLTNITLDVDLTRPNDQAVEGTLYLYSKSSSSSSTQTIWSSPICDGCWGTTYSVSIPATLYDTDFDETGGFVYVSFNSTSGIDYTSSNWPVEITPAPITNNSISGNQTINSGETPSAITGSNPNGGNGSYNYQWKKKTTGSWSAISGATSKNYSPSALTITTQYQRIVTSNSLQHTSNTVTITVNSWPDVSNNTIYFDENTTTFIGSTPSGGDGQYEYKWYYWPVFIIQLGAEANHYPNSVSPETGKDLVLTPAFVQLMSSSGGAYFSRQVISNNKSYYSNWFLIGINSSSESGKNLKDLTKNKNDDGTLISLFPSVEAENYLSDYNLTANKISSNTELLNKKSLKIYPNPFSETVNFEVSYLKDTFVEIYLYSESLTEKALVYKGNIRSGKQTISYNIPSNYPNGLYLYEIIENGVRKSGKLIKI